MAIYQAPRRRWRAALVCGLVALLAGLGIGYALHRTPKPDPVAVLHSIDADLSRTADGLDVLVIHGQAATAASNSERVEEEALARVRAGFNAMRAVVRTLDPRAEREVDTRLTGLEQLIRKRASAREIASSAASLARFLRAIVGG